MSQESTAAVDTPRTEEGRPNPDDRHKPDKPPRYAVVLHNDPFNSMEFVALVLMKVFGYDTNRCIRLMLVAHRRGKAHVWTGLKEPAELKAEQVRGCGADRETDERAKPLKVTVEPLPED